MYSPPHNRAELPEILAFVRAHPFATLVTADSVGGLCATHLPLLIARAEPSDPDDAPLRLIGHVAIANGQAAALATGAPTLAIFQGPHAYISPTLYEQPLSVPTWNYIAVHAHGEATILEPPAAKQRVVDAMVRHFDPTYAPQHAALPAEFIAAKLKGIVAFELTVTRWEARFKLSQDRSATDRRTVAAALAGQAGNSAAVEMGVGMGAE